MATNTRNTTKPAEPEQQTFELGDEYDDLLRIAQRPVVKFATKDRKPVKGDKLAGTIVSETKILTDFGPAVMSLFETTSKPDAPLVSFVWLGTVLSTAHERHEIGTGSRAAVVCQGEVKTPNSKFDGYMDWSVHADNRNRTSRLSVNSPVTGSDTDPAEEPF